MANLGPRPATLLALASFALLILVGILAAAMAERVNRAADRVARSLEAEAIATELLDRAPDLELCQRGFLPRGSDAFLPPYAEARAAIPQALAKLRSLVADNPDQTARVERMRPMIDELLASEAATAEFGRTRQFAEATEISATGRGQQVLQSFRALIDAFRLAENGLLGQRQAAESSARAVMLGLILIALASAAAAALGALFTGAALIRELREGAEALAKEVSARKEAQAMLAQTQKMESICLLADGVAHDFNNLMTVILGNLDSAERRLARAGPGDAAAIGPPIAAATQGARRAASLTRRMLAFSRQQVLAPEPADLNKLIGSLSEMLTRTVGETIAVETVFASGLWPAFADISQLEKAIVNLVINARDAMPEGGRIILETANAALDEDYCAQFGDVEPGQYVLLSVTDTGTGISPENLGKMFEPFFTREGAATGASLGLSMVYGFVKQSKGHIRLCSELRHGTTAKIYLPRMAVSARVESVPGIQRKEDAPAGSGRPGEVVLIVEDDEDVRDSTVVLLGELGYSVLAARNGGEALERLQGSERIDILFTDVVLAQGMNGRALAVQASALRPGLPVLFTTGYARDAIIGNGGLDPGVHFLGKPYTQQEIAQKLRAALDARAKA